MSETRVEEQQNLDETGGDAPRQGGATGSHGEDKETPDWAKDPGPDEIAPKMPTPADAPKVRRKKDEAKKTAPPKVLAAVQVLAALEQGHGGMGVFSLHELLLLGDKANRTQNRIVIYTSWPEGQPRERWMTIDELADDYERNCRKYIFVKESSEDEINLCERRFGALEDGRYGKVVIAIQAAYRDKVEESGGVDDLTEQDFADILRRFSGSSMPIGDLEHQDQISVDPSAIGLDASDLQHVAGAEGTPA